MLANFLKVALRNLRRHRGHNLLNLAGLATGLTCVLLILLFVRDELRYDRHHARADRIYRLTMNEFARSGGPAGPLLLQDFPEVEQVVRLKRHREVFVRRGDVGFYETDGYYADSTIFDVFTLPLVRGDVATALTRPATVVLTESTAKRYFGSEDPLGRTLTLNNELDVQVTGVVRDVPRTSHFRFAFLVSQMTDVDPTNESWIWINFFTYVLLADGASPDALVARMPEWVGRYVEPAVARDQRYDLQPLTRIHLHSKLQREMEPNGDAGYVRVFSAIALFILAIACINFTNLSTARATLRAKEVGVRKALGARQRSLVLQFLTESVLLSLAAAAVAVALSAALLPAFDALTGKALVAADLLQPAFLGGVLGVALVVGVAAGGYPAFVLSAFDAVTVLKGQGRGSGNAVLRRGLVVAQFALSILLLVGTGVVYRQLDYIRDRNLGFDRAHVVLVPIRAPAMAEGYEAVKQRLLAHPGVVRVAASRGHPGGPDLVFALQPEGMEPEDVPTIGGLLVDHDFVETYGLEIVAGRDFSREHSGDVMGGFIVNEEAARQLGWADPLGRMMAIPVIDLPRVPVVGVVRDFHFRSLHEPIGPMVFLLPTPDRFNLFSVKIRPERLDETLAFLEKTWAELDPGRPFTYTFLDERVERLHTADARTGRIVTVFAGLAVVLACLGLFGLAAFTVEQRTKEIGIRKVLGASVAGIVLLLSGTFARLVGLAFVVAVPVGYVVMHRWLEGFAYHAGLSWTVFAGAGLVTVVVALATVGYQTLRAALADPVRSLRHE